MTPVTTPRRDGATELDQPRRGLGWLQRDEGWAPGEGAGRLAAAILIALVAVGFKVAVVRGLGGELGYLSYVGAVVLGAWVAGLRGGLLTTAICALAEVLLFSGSVAEAIGSDLFLLHVGLFLFDGALVSVITSGLRRATYREQTARAEREVHFQAELAAREAAERDQAALLRLQTVTASLAGAATPLEVADAILDRGLTALGADAGGVSQLSADGTALELIAARGYPPAEAQPGRIFPLDRPSHLADAVATGQPVLLGSAAEWTARYPASPPHPLDGSTDGGAIAALPLISGGQLIGGAVFRFAAARDFDDGTGELAVRLAEQGALALDRAIAYDRELRARAALERGQDRLAFLAEASDRIGARLDIAGGLDEVARLAVPTLADWCAIELLDLDRPLLAIAALDERRRAAIADLAAIAPRSLGAWLATHVVDAGSAIVTIEASWSERLTDPRAVALLAELETKTCLVAPILGPADAPVGSIVLGAARPDRFEADDLALVRDLSGRIGSASGQARLFGAVDRFKATVDVIADAVFMFDPRSLRLTYVNRGASELVGQPPDALIGSSVLRLQPAAVADRFLERIRHLRDEADASTTFTGTVARGDGSEVPIEAFMQEVTLPDGGTTAILTARNVSERIDVQARLTRIAGDERRQAAELRAVIQAMGEGILVVDHRGDISLANDAATEILGELPRSIGELASQLNVDAIDLPTTEQSAAEGDGEPRTVALADGRWLEVSTYAADLGGGLIDSAGPSRIVVLRDVTRARDAEAAREAFLGVLSHELRTPVTTIFGYAKVLQRSSRREDRDEMLGDIEVEADRLYRIVEDLLALSRVEGGGLAIEGEPLLVQHLAGPVIESEAQRWTRIHFETDLPPGLPAVFGERTYVEQVLRNMVSNAGKYSPPDSVVTISASTTPTEVLIRVLDRGAGIQEDEAERLFELYYRSPATARSAAGAGIGLYVGRGLITAMGGRIWARPRPGGGSEFGFSLPRCDEDPVPTAHDGAVAGV